MKSLRDRITYEFISDRFGTTITFNFYDLTIAHAYFIYNKDKVLEFYTVSTTRYLPFLGDKVEKIYLIEWAFDIMKAETDNIWSGDEDDD